MCSEHKKYAHSKSAVRQYKGLLAPPMQNHCFFTCFTVFGKFGIEIHLQRPDPRNPENARKPIEIHRFSIVQGTGGASLSLSDSTKIAEIPQENEAFLILRIF